MTVREATVGPESGTFFVDGDGEVDARRSRRRGRRPRSAGRRSRSPGPISVEAVRTRARPPGRRSTATFPFRYFSPEPVKPAPWRKTAAPMPRRDAPGARPAARARFSAKPLAAIAFSTHSCDADRLLQRLPGRRRVAEAEEVLLAAARAGRCRASARSRSMCRSMAQIGLRRAEAAEGAVRRRVRRDGERLDRDVLPAVGAAGVEGAAREDDGGERDVGAAVEEDRGSRRREASRRGRSRSRSRRARGGASSWPRRPPGGRRRASRGGPTSSRGGGRGGRGASGTPPCRRSRRR